MQKKRVANVSFIDFRLAQILAMHGGNIKIMKVDGTTYVLKVVAFSLKHRPSIKFFIKVVFFLS